MFSDYLTVTFAKSGREPKIFGTAEPKIGFSCYQFVIIAPATAGTRQAASPGHGHFMAGKLEGFMPALPCYKNISAADNPCI